MRENKKLITVLIYLALSFASLFPAVLNFTQFKYGSNYHGFGSDSYGMLKDLWWRSEGKNSAYNVDGKYLLEGYPNSIKPAEENQIPFLVALGAAALAGPVAGYNFSVLISFLFTFLCTHLLAVKIFKDRHISIFASVLFTVTSYHIYQSADHLDLSYFGIVPLFAWMLLQAFEKNKTAYWPMFISIAALSSFIHPYFTIILSLFLGTFVLMSFKAEWFRNARFYGSAVLSSFLSFGLIKLWQMSYSVQGESVFSIQRDVGDLKTYSLRFFDYMAPPVYSFFFTGAAEWKLKLTQMSGSNLAENTVYLGIIPMLLIPYGLFSLRSCLKEFYSSTTWTGKLIISLFLCGIIFALPLPASVLFKVLPQFRTISRMAVLVLLGSALFSAWVLQHKTSFNKLSLKSKNLVLAGAVLFIFLDQGHLHFGFYTDTKDVPAIYQAVEKMTPAEANILELPYVWGYIPTYWTTRLKRRSFYHFDQNSLNTQLVMKADLKSIESLKQFSKENKIDYVILHSDKKIPGLSGETMNEVNEQTLFYKGAVYSYLLKM